MPNPMLPVEGPKSFKDTYNTATLGGAIGRAHEHIDKAAAKLIEHPDQFALTGPDFETRRDKFVNTTKTFFKAGGSAAAIVGDGLMLPLDLVTGRGSAPESGQKKDFLDEGVLGNGARLVGTLTSAGAEMVGKGVGAGAAAVGIAAKDTDECSKEWIKDGAKTGGKAAGATTGVVLGAGVGIVANALRAPSLIVKGTLKGVGSVVSGIIGVFAGTVRAIINK